MKHLASIAHLTVMAVLLAFPGCGRDVREGGNGAAPEKAGDNGSALMEEYKKEGFVSNGIFRVVIVEPRESTGRDGGKITDEAKKRAYLSLKRYLMSENRIVTANVDASLLNLVESEGTLTAIEDNSRTRTVYFYDIKKNNVRGYVDGLAPKR